MKMDFSDRSSPLGTSNFRSGLLKFSSNERYLLQLNLLQSVAKVEKFETVVNSMSVKLGPFQSPSKWRFKICLVRVKIRTKILLQCCEVPKQFCFSLDDLKIGRLLSNRKNFSFKPVKLFCRSNVTKHDVTLIYTVSQIGYSLLYIEIVCSN